MLGDASVEEGGFFLLKKVRKILLEKEINFLRIVCLCLNTSIGYGEMHFETKVKKKH